MVDLAVLQQILGISFNALPLLQRALIHSSYANESQGFTQNTNERLEFLGDAVLGFVFAEKLYQELPQSTEGEMTKLRAALVRRDTLTRIARTIGLGDYLYMGKGEEANDGRDKSANLEGALEAVIAAVFLDQGLTIARDCILRLFSKELQKVAAQGAGIDYKSKLQELIQAKRQWIPTYHLEKVVGPDHKKKFTIEVKVGGVALGRGSGKSKKAAETEAARSALEQLPVDFTQ